MAISSTQLIPIAAPINIEYFTFSMLSTVLPYHTALQEIPTGLKALGMTNLVVLTKINDHLAQ